MTRSSVRLRARLFNAQKQGDAPGWCMRTAPALVGGLEARACTGPCSQKKKKSATKNMPMYQPRSLRYHWPASHLPSSSSVGSRMETIDLPVALLLCADFEVDEVARRG